MLPSPGDRLPGTFDQDVYIELWHRWQEASCPEDGVITFVELGPGNVLTQPSAPTGPDGVATGTLQSIVPGSKVVSAVVNGAVAIAFAAL